MDGIIVAIAFFVIALIFAITAIVAVWSNTLTDKEREKWGLGPKGQGR
jgi:hypothetical protein